MIKTAEKLKLELSHLSTQERAEIASFLIHSLDLKLLSQVCETAT